MPKRTRTKAEPVPEIVAEPVPEAADEDAFLDHLLSLRQAVEDECEVQPDIIKAALLRIASGLDTLKDARWQVFMLARGARSDLDG